jgi:hypothetical protein
MILTIDVGIQIKGAVFEQTTVKEYFILSRRVV